VDDSVTGPRLRVSGFEIPETAHCDSLYSGAVPLGDGLSDSQAALGRRYIAPLRGAAHVSGQYRIFDLCRMATPNIRRWAAATEASSRMDRNPG